MYFKINFYKFFYRNPIRVSNSLDLDPDRILSVLIWVQTVCLGYQKITKVAASIDRVKVLILKSLPIPNLNLLLKSSLIILYCIKLNFSSHYNIYIIDT